MYEPQVNDYVRWTTALGMVHEGWVYYKSTPLDNTFRKKNGWREIDPYITIEIATKPRPDCDLSTFLHKRIHVCLCCPECNWHELEFIKHRNTREIQHYSQYDEVSGIQEEGDKLSKMYKSQEGRLPDY